MNEKEARALVAALTESEKAALYELLLALRQKPVPAERLAG